MTRWILEVCVSKLFSLLSDSLFFRSPGGIDLEHQKYIKETDLFLRRLPFEKKEKLGLCADLMRGAKIN